LPALEIFFGTQYNYANNKKKSCETGAKLGYSKQTPSINFLSFLDNVQLADHFDYKQAQLLFLLRLTLLPIRFHGRASLGSKLKEGKMEKK